MSEKNKALVRRYVEEIWNQGKLSSIDELVGENYSHFSSQLPRAQGAEALKEMVSGLRAAFPDGRFSIEEEVGEGDTVVNRWTFQGTHRGEWLGIAATGRQVKVNGTATSQIKGGKLVDHWADWDALGMMQQLGAIEKKF
jgi:steroid delta-isomerase-like uncharacterized protein